MTRVVPPVIGLAWVGAQVAVTTIAGGRRRFPGQRFVAATIAAGGLALGAGAVGLFRQAGTTARPDQPTEASALVTEGLYSYTRNPMYLALLVELFAVSVGTGRVRTLVALPGMLWSLGPQIDAEEAALTERFGEYCARVPRWL